MIVARTCGPLGPDMWPGQPRHWPGMAPDRPDMCGHVARGVGGCRWLMHDEMLGCFILLLGCLLCGKCRSPFLRSKGVGGFR